MREPKPWSLPEKIGILGVFVGLAAGATLTAAAVRYPTDTALWDLVLWNGITMLLGSVACALLLISSHHSGRSFMMPLVLVLIEIGFIVAGIHWHLSSNGTQAIAEPEESGITVSGRCDLAGEPPTLPPEGEKYYVELNEATVQFAATV
jgi:hypothetical protein